MVDKSVANQLRKLGVKNADVLVQMAERGQLLVLRCEMPQCYYHKGRSAFDPVGTPGNKWTPSRDHYPIIKSAGGKLVPENVRLSHAWCNNRDCHPGPRHEPMDGRHGAQGLRVLVRVRCWVPLAREGAAPGWRRQPHARVKQRT